MSEVAWAAGFFDGEGHIGFYRQGNSGRMKVGLAQVAREPLDRFRQFVGDGKIWGPLSWRGSGKRRPVFQYQLHGFWPIADLIARLWPWLSGPKREQAAAAATTRAVRHHVLHGRVRATRDNQ